ncbi:rhodanese-like domain-containing protein [Aeromicrobium sp.]|uniref:rhodanese-like domain-containing protein n=1 Tax=Aeromicrobium sp. TaxID=1871063 RepID=UPI003C35575B
MNEFGIPTTDITGVPEVIPADLVVLDVRESHEWSAGHIIGAIHIPLGELQARVGELDPDARTVVVCHVGGRSARATEWLHSQGHDVINLAGGMDAWEQAGRPVARGDL